MGGNCRIGLKKARGSKDWMESSGEGISGRAVFIPGRINQDVRS